MDEKDVLSLTGGEQFSEHLDNVENQPPVLHGDQNFHVQESNKADRSKTGRSWKTSDLAERSFSRNAPKKTESNNLSWRKRVTNNDENNLSGTEGARCRSNAWSSFPSYSRSSFKRNTCNEKKETNWREDDCKIKETPVEFKFGKNRNKTSFFADRPDKNNERNRAKIPNQEQFIGYKYLKVLSEKQPLEMISEILKPDADITSVLNRKELQTDWIFLIMEILRKLCECDFKTSRIEILQFFCESPLMDHISHYLGEVGIEKDTNIIENFNSFISDLVVFYSTVIDTIPTVAVDKNFDKFLKKTKMCAIQIETYLRTKIDQTILEKLASLEKVLENETNIREKKAKKPHRNYLDLLSNLPPPDDFRELKLYPTHEDLNRQDFGFVRPNKVKGAYEDVDHYLDVQFRLIREDFIDPLRRGINQYKNAVALQGKPKYKYESVRFYPDTLIENIELTIRGEAGYVVNFNKNGRLNKIEWEYNKWFMFGSLLLFTRDNFNSYFFATVSNRDIEKLEKGRILVTLIENEPLGANMLDKPFLMAESEVYFEPYGLVMKALKNFDKFNFPMKQFIVDGDTVTSIPRYILKDDFSIYGYRIDLLRNDGWPHPSAIGFDEHQFNAFKTALTSNFTVIQGPPGTGKTYLGLRIVEVLLHNIERREFNYLYEDEYDYYLRDPVHFRAPVHDSVFPILVVCYTNHALDQFLEGILKFNSNIVRIGGQSKSDLLEKFNLRGRENFHELRKEARELYPTFILCRKVVRNTSNRIGLKNEEKKIIENPSGILSYSSLSRVMSPYFKRIINDEETLLFWLFNNDHFMTQNILRIISNSKDRVAKTGGSVNIDRIDPVKVGEKIHDVEKDENMMNAADVFIDEDDIFDPQNVDEYDRCTDVEYCVSMRDLQHSLMRTQINLANLNPELFSDYSMYYDSECQLIETLKITERQCEILDFYFRNAELDSSFKYNTRNENLWEMPIDQRWSIYWTLVSRLRDNLVEQLKSLEVFYRFKCQQYEELKQLEDFHIVKNSSVVGMTTTCAARLQLFLKTLSPTIVIVEEAAEVLESHIVVSLNENCKHVILIGDHKQLKPSSAVYELSKKYNIDVSLFERMINNNMYCPQLQVQHRMREEVSKLIVPSIYPELKNHQSVLEYPSIKGVTKNLFFVEHTVYEETVNDSSSRKNKFEAEFVINLCCYLLLQGYETDKITILTTYTGQMFLLKEMKRDYDMMKDVKVVVVDKYQGEENDIILLSLVRSNEERNIGFLSIENRVCVALSRAKIGLYIIGNMDILSDSPLWKNIKKELIEQEAIGPKLTLYCEKHDVYTPVSSTSDFNNVPLGGCRNMCEEVMDCGHECQLLCHKIEMKCPEKCSKQCDENHPCAKLCYEDCGLCTVPVERNLPCGHTVTFSCFVKDYLERPCRVETNVILESCSHEVKKLCFQLMEMVRCTFPCEDQLKCGHRCVNNCHKTDDPDHLKYECREPCEKINRGCSKEHKCEKLCFEDCGKCKVRLDFTLPCGHSTTLACSVDLGRIKCYQSCEKQCAECKAACPKKCYEDCKPCRNKVTKRMPDCGHEKKIACSVDPGKLKCCKSCEKKCPECDTACPKKCFEECKPCRNKVTKRIPDCGHEEEIECSVAPERKLCKKKCERIGPCGHRCKSLCSEPCSTDQCMEIVKSTCVQALCGHGYADVQCWKKNETISAKELLPYCTEPCAWLLTCGDLCSGTCGSCWQGRFHKMCGKKCENVFVCGHSCTYPCGKICPPCTEKCQYSCIHFKCSNDCGEHCVRCEKNCEWKCVHYKCTKKCSDICNRPPCDKPCPKKLPCEHDCIGFCGEPCPMKCRICDKEEVTAIIFGNEDVENARFVLLEDCGHIIESRAMDGYLSTSAEKGKIVMKLCPLCKTPISKTLRYMNQVKKFYTDIQRVKVKIRIHDTRVRQIQDDLRKKLNDLNLSNKLLRNTELVFIQKMVIQFRLWLGNREKQSNLTRKILGWMDFYTNVFSSIISRLDDLKRCVECDMTCIFGILPLLLKRLSSSVVLKYRQIIDLQLVEDTVRELSRYHRLVDYSVFLNEPGYQSNRDATNVKNISADIVDILYGWKCFDNEQDARIGELFEKLQKETSSVQSVSQEENRVVHAAMTKDFYDEVNSHSCWFTCTNGHYYVNGHAKRTEEKNNCPECDDMMKEKNEEIVEYLFIV